MIIEKEEKQSNLTVFGKIYFTAILLDLLLLAVCLFVPAIPVKIVVKVLCGLGIVFVGYLALKIVLGIWGIKLHFIFKDSNKSFLAFLLD